MFIAPMLLQQREFSFDDERFLFEPKLDGHRLIVSFINGQAKLYTRFKTEVTERYPELAKVPVDHLADVVLDGEVVYLNPQTGAVEFETLMQRFRMLRRPRILEGMKQYPVSFYAFDMLYYNGQQLGHLPLIERKRMLKEAFVENNYYHYMEHVPGYGSELFKAVQICGLEGIVAKKKNSLYKEKRSSNWLKINNPEYSRIGNAGQ